MKQRILLVEDEESILDILILNLELENYEVIAATDGSKALKYFKSAKFDLVIMDVMLPELDGFAVCKSIRMENLHTPILFLTAKNTTEDKLTGLKIGADDFMTKPFNLEEFLLRVGILLKRSARNTSTQTNINDTFIFDNFEIDFSTYQIIGLNNKVHQLSKKEVLLLKLLVEKANEVVSRDTILERVWGYEVYPTSRTIDNFILSFRRYFETNPRNPKYIHSIRGVGYQFTPQGKLA